MPLGKYPDFAACVADHVKQGKSAEAARRICGVMERDMNKSMLVLEKTAERRYTLGVVYEPDVVDTQGDFAKAEDIEAAAWDFMDRLQKTAHNASVILQACAKGQDIELDVTDLLEKSGLDDEHLQVGDKEELGVIVESYLAPQDLSVNGHIVKKGAWLLGVRWSLEMFNKIKSGDRQGLSMYGRADRVQG